MIPKYILNKIDRLNSLLGQAYTLKCEIEKWAESKGVDTSGMSYHTDVIDESSEVMGISKEAFYEYLENMQN